MKIALQLDPTPHDVQWARQLGVRHAVWGTPEYPNGYFALEDLVAARDSFARAGIELGVIENMPMHFYDKVMAGLPGRDEQLERICLSIRNMGKAGIPVLGYNWMILGGISTDSVRGRGGARERRFELEAALRAPTAALDWRAPGRPIHLPDTEMSRDQVWANLVYFLERVLPAAEEAGVKLAAHPDDAPIPTFLGVARVLGCLDDFQRLIEAVPSPANGIDFCQGTFSEMAGLDVIEAIYHFGAQQKIFFAHFRDTQGALPRFDEVFMDEGDTDMVAAARAYRNIRFEGLIRADHTPQVVGDPHAHRGFAFQIGYMRGLWQAGQALTGPRSGAPERSAKRASSQVLRTCAKSGTTAVGEPEGAKPRSGPVPGTRAAAGGPATRTEAGAEPGAATVAHAEAGAGRSLKGVGQSAALALALDCRQDEDVMYAQQFGVTHLLATLAAGSEWDAAGLAGLRNRVEKAGLVLAGIERLPVGLDKTRLGQMGRDEEIEGVCRFLKAAGRAKIGLVGYQWSGTLLPEQKPDGRGAAMVRCWDRGRADPGSPGTDPDRHQKPTGNGLASPPEPLWENLAYFLERVLPTAEAAGVRMASHPDDPPTADRGPGILGSVQGLQRLLALRPSPCHGLDLCTGAVLAMPGADLPALIRTLGAERVFMLHVANVRDDGSGLAEAFLDEGEVDAVQVLRACREAGFAGVLRPANGPGMLDDTTWGHKAKAFSTGYLRAVLQTLERC